MITTGPARIDTELKLLRSVGQSAEAFFYKSTKNHMQRRRATHAGSWYPSDPSTLSRELDDFLSNVEPKSNTASVSAVIVPHAGYSYSGQTAAFSYVRLSSVPESQRPRTVFIFGPSHHVYLEGKNNWYIDFVGCALPTARVYDTPLGSLDVDQDILASLRRTGMFSTVSVQVEEAEHSIEMQLPFLKHIYKEYNSALI